MLQAFQPSCSSDFFIHLVAPLKRDPGRAWLPWLQHPQSEAWTWGFTAVERVAVGRAVVGTAGALPAHHQDASAPGEGWEVSQKLESLKPCEIPHYGYTFAEFRV